MVETVENVLWGGINLCGQKEVTAANIYICSHMEGLPYNE
jgi:hypothetical protein